MGKRKEAEVDGWMDGWIYVYVHVHAGYSKADEGEAASGEWVTKVCSNGAPTTSLMQPVLVSAAFRSCDCSTWATRWWLLSFVACFFTHLRPSIAATATATGQSKGSRWLDLGRWRPLFLSFFLSLSLRVSPWTGERNNRARRNFERRTNEEEGRRRRRRQWMEDSETGS